MTILTRVVRSILAFCMLDEIPAEDIFEIFFFYFSPEEKALTFHANYLRRQFACNAKDFFPWKNKKIIANSLSAELAQKMLKVNHF